MPVKVLPSTFGIALVVLGGWNCWGDHLFEPPLKMFGGKKYRKIQK